MGRDLCARCLQSFDETDLTAVGNELLCPACQRASLRPAPAPPHAAQPAAAPGERPAGPAAESGAPAPPAARSHNKKLFVGIGAAAVVGLVIVVGFIAFIFSLSGPLTERVDEFFRLGTSGRCAAAYRDCTTAGFKKRFSLQDTERRMAGGGGYLRARMSRFKIINSQATWQGALVFANGRSVPTVVLLEKEGGQWRIAAISN